MKILVYSDNAEIYCDTLNGVGHTARPLWQNDLITNVLNFEPRDCIIYDLRGEPVLPHDEVFKEIAGNRIIVIGQRDNPLIPFLAGLGVRDFLFPPINPEDIVHRVENPSTPAETAELLKTVPGLQPERIVQIIETATPPPKTKKDILKTDSTQEKIIITTDSDDDEIISSEAPPVETPLTPSRSIIGSTPTETNLTVSDVLGAVGDTVTIGFNITRIIISTIIIALAFTLLLYGAGIVFDTLNWDNGLPGKIIELKALIDRGWQGWL